MIHPATKPALKAILERHAGRKSAIGRRELRRILEVTEKEDRQLRRLIGELRLEGFPVMFATSDPAGYYIPETLAELREGIDKMRSYVIDECLVMRAWKQKGSQYINGEKQGVLMR